MRKVGDEEDRIVKLKGCAGYQIVLAALDEGLDAESSNRCWLGINLWLLGSSK